MGSALATLFVGLIVGAVARLLMPGDQKIGWILTCVLGVAGSFLANTAGQALGWYAPGQAAGWIASILGALVLLFVVGRLTRSQS
ncbi:MAG: GlsB/YeaQ/YmgE family stress response membrane protein [Ideonella sp. MAG2]|nr:MAG: GlsB/YeaQ/YmgE family stress response membrane protein [Ideonella sp. MAG2]